MIRLTLTLLYKKKEGFNEYDMMDALDCLITDIGAEITEIVDMIDGHRFTIEYDKLPKGIDVMYIVACFICLSDIYSYVRDVRIPPDEVFVEQV